MNNENKDGIDYLDVTYDENEKPRTDFPFNLAKYLVDRFHLENSKILDVGCGRCEVLDAFNKLGLDISGVDASERIRGFAPKEISKLEILDFSKENLPFNDDEFDVIFTKSVIEHVSDPTHLMKEILRILKPKGIFISLTPEWASQMKTFYDDPTHVHPYQLKGLKDLLILSEFKDVHAEIFYYYELLWESSFWRFFASILRKFISNKTGRSLTESTGIKLFRWGVERQILGIGYK
ncbi:methyltransferase domain-containing protein [Marine Group I thaumarchaeote]|uniref:Methyltransferase domain-containing protein n=1 Tax=Marine Group I thaumarchaeote TaxID=2511932 RepID=A0A7K4MLZ9_9ARCH|nr:methyltransferase domain-containing protein [Marine Group I thaumarchaeote]